ncbi:hypothetical protein HPP92_026106, partial [Vanilla planifolia]
VQSSSAQPSVPARQQQQTQPSIPITSASLPSMNFSTITSYFESLHIYHSHQQGFWFPILHHLHILLRFITFPYLPLIPLPNTTVTYPYGQPSSIIFTKSWYFPPAIAAPSSTAAKASYAAFPSAFLTDAAQSGFSTIKQTTAPLLSNICFILTAYLHLPFLQGGNHHYQVSPPPQQLYQGGPPIASDFRNQPGTSMQPERRPWIPGLTEKPTAGVQLPGPTSVPLGQIAPSPSALPPRLPL